MTIVHEACKQTRKRRRTQTICKKELYSSIYTQKNRKEKGQWRSESVYERWDEECVCSSSMYEEKKWQSKNRISGEKGVRCWEYCVASRVGLLPLVLATRPGLRSLPYIWLGRLEIGVKNSQKLRQPLVEKVERKMWIKHQWNRWNFVKMYAPILWKCADNVRASFVKMCAPILCGWIYVAPQDSVVEISTNSIVYPRI